MTTIDRIDIPDNNVELVHINVEHLHPADDNPRHELGDLTELAASITSVGILQPLVVVERAVGGGYTIVAGHRRHAAAKLVGAETVPCIVRAMSVDERQTAMLVENLHRKDLDPLDEATGFQHLADLGHSQREIAELVGCNQSHVSRRLALIKLPEKAVDLVRAGTIHVRQAEQLAALPDDDIDDVVAQVAERFEGRDELPSWAIDESIKKVANERKRAAAIAAAEASGLKQAKSRPYDGAGDYRPYDGAGDYRPCKKSEATHWYVDHDGTSVMWCRTAKAHAKATSDAGGIERPKPDWQVRQERNEEITRHRHQVLASLYGRDPERVLFSGLELATEGIVEGLESFGFDAELIGRVAADPVHLVAFDALAMQARPSYGDEDVAIVAMWAALESGAGVDPAEADEPEPPTRCRREACPDWEGESEKDCGGCVIVDEPIPVDESEVPATEVVQEPEAPQASQPAEVDDSDFWDPIEAPKRPWATYDGNDEPFICKMVSNFTVPASIHEVIAYETATSGRERILETCEVTLAKLVAREV